MRIKSIFAVCIVTGLLGCSGGDAIKEVVELKHPNGSPKKTVYFRDQKRIHSEPLFSLKTGNFNQISISN